MGRLGTFRLEEFQCLHDGINGVSFPYAEMLYRPPHKTTADFFAAARTNIDTIVTTDLDIFEQAIAEHMRLARPVSVNLNAETIFDDRLLDSINRIMKAHPNFRAQDVLLEITEDGGIPDNFDGLRLTHIKDMGFKLALDDFNPTIDEEWGRLNAFLPYVDVVKLPYKVMEDVRDRDIGQGLHFIRKAQAACTGKILVIEGHRVSDHQYDDRLKHVGITFVQKSGYSTDGLAPQL